MKKRILVPNGNYTDIRLIEAYKKMGYYVITSGNNPNLQGHKYADQYICEDYSDKDKMLELVKSLNIDFVSSCANDFGVITAAYIAEKIGLPGHDTYENSLIIHQKDRFKQFAKKHNLMTPIAECFDDLELASEWAKNAEFPIIIKPVDLTGGKGVTRADTTDEAIYAIKRAFLKSKVKRIVIEPFIEGTQHSITTFLVNRKVVIDYSCNEFSFTNPYLVEMTTAPAFDYDSIRDILVGQIEKIASILKLTDGIFHMQYRMRSGKPLIIEAMRRCLGNWFLYQTSHMTAINWEEWIAKAHCGMDCSSIPRDRKMKGFECEKYIMSEKNGIIKNVLVSDEISKYIYHKYMIWEPMHEITNYTVEMLGYLFLKFDNMEERDYYARNINEHIEIEYA